MSEALGKLAFKYKPDYSKEKEVNGESYGVIRMNFEN
jgi:hypothetical protein